LRAVNLVFVRVALRLGDYKWKKLGILTSTTLWEHFHTVGECIGS